MSAYSQKILQRLNRLLIWPLILCCSFWQRVVSPFFGNNCRFHPTCSEYMIQALKTHGLIRGLVLGIKRIFRCNSLFEGGEDPVPQQEPSSL